MTFKKIDPIEITPPYICMKFNKYRSGEILSEFV